MFNKQDLKIRWNQLKKVKPIKVLWMFVVVLILLSTFVGPLFVVFLGSGPVPFGLF